MKSDAFIYEILFYKLCAVTAEKSRILDGDTKIDRGNMK